MKSTKLFYGGTSTNRIKRKEMVVMNVFSVFKSSENTGKRIFMLHGCFVGGLFQKNANFLIAIFMTF